MIDPSFKSQLRSLLVMRIWRWVTQTTRGPSTCSIHKSNLHQESLGRYRRFYKSHSIEHFTSSRNFRKKDSGMPNGSNRIWQKGRIHRRPHPTVVKGGPYSFLSPVPRGEDGGLISCAFGETMVAQTSIGLVHLLLVCEGKDEQQNDMHSRKSLAIRASGGSFSRNYVLRPMGSIWGKLSIKAMRHLQTQVGRHPK